MSNEDLVKVHIDLPNHWAIGGESLWATPLGNDLYRLENVPFFAYGINFWDVVLATAESDELKPEVRQVVTASGHRTYRVMFPAEVDRAKQEEVLGSLEQYGATFERADKRNVAIDIKPTGDLIAIYDRLDDYEANNLLCFETCEARVEGSFDDLPED